MKNSPDQISDRNIVDFSILFSKHYLAAGGPTSRLEDCLGKVANHYGKDAEVFATPTGVFVSLLQKGDSSHPITALARIKKNGTNLGKLCDLENLFAQILEGNLSLNTAARVLLSRPITGSAYRYWQSALAAMVGGFGISFGSFQRLPVAIVSGLITSIVWMLSDFLVRRYPINPVFTDFIGAFVTLVLAAAAHALFIPASMEAYALGGIVLLVPGLMLTTAIAELADQNLVSGTAKFMQATMTLMALGLAYLLFQQISFTLGLRTTLMPVSNKAGSLWVSALAILLNVSCYSVIFSVPLNALFWASFTGLTGWVCLQLALIFNATPAAPFLAAVMVGFTSLTFGRLLKLPSQVFSVPGIIAMLPGMLALSSFRYFASGDEQSGLALGFKVVVTAVSIVFGLMSARLPFLLFAKRQK